MQTRLIESTMDEVYDNFNESDVETDSLDGSDLDDVEIDPFYDCDPFDGLEEIYELNDALQNDLQEVEKCKITWTRQPFSGEKFPFQHKSNDNLRNDLAENLKTPLEYFKGYFNEEIFEQFALYTNLYAQQQSVKNFAPTNASEIKILFGLHILMGVVKLPRVKMYWWPILNLDIWKTNMTCDRFFELRSNLHIMDNFAKPSDCVDKFFKVRPALEAVRSRLLEFDVDEVLSVDEQIVPFMGRHVDKQFIKEKPYPWGLKVFIICGKNGLPYDFFIYQGSTTELSPTNLKKYGFCASVVLHLVNRLDRRGHQLYCDNYFTTYQLLETLKDKQLNVAGTIRVNRFSNPPLLSDKEMSKKGRGYCDSVVSQNGKVVLVKWQDNKSVNIASNFVGVGTSDTARRWDKKLKKHIDVNRPEIISLYNSGMGGVDLLDQLISYYRIFIKSKK